VAVDLSPQPGEFHASLRAANVPGGSKYKLASAYGGVSLDDVARAGALFLRPALLYAGHCLYRCKVLNGSLHLFCILLLSTIVSHKERQDENLQFQSPSLSTDERQYADCARRYYVGRLCT